MKKIEKIPKLKAQSVTFYTECNNDAATIQSFAEGRILDGTTLEDTNDITIDDTHVIITGDSVTTKEYNTTAGRIGYSFNGWYTDAALSKPLDTTSMITSGTTIYADMQKETYCIDYVTNGGTINSGKVDSYTHGDTVNLTQDVTKDGYTFVGWHYAKSLTDDVVTTIDANMGRDITLYAEWEANDFDYKVNHYILDTDGVHYTLKESETFTGKTDEEVTPSVKTYTGFTSPDTKTVTLLYGHDIVIDYYYTRNQYKVTLKKDENIQKTSGAGSYYYGAEVTIEATPKTGYSFSKWQDDNDVLSDSTVNNTSFILGDSDVTLEAKSLINQYDVSYIDWLDDTSVSNTDKLGSDVTALDYNSTVRGDDLGDDKTPGVYYKGRVYDRCTEETVGTDGATVYRYFKNASYKVTLDLNDGSGNIFDTVNVQYDNHYPALKTPSRTGYTFLGWNTKSNGSGDMITEDSIVNNDSDDTFYAIWKANIYTVFFDANGGTVTPEQKEVTYNTTYGELPIPTRTGYQFLKWLDDNNNEVTSDTIVTITKNQTLKAAWKKMAHTLTFDAGKGSVSPSSKIVAYDDEYGELPTPVCKGYDFVEWNYKEDGTGDALNTSDVVDTTEDETVYAIYKPITYTIQLDPDGGEVSTNVITYTIEDEVTLPDANKRGYTFEGWGEKKITSLPKGTTGNLKFKATYNAIVYKISYDYNTGVLKNGQKNPDTYTVETEDFAINNPVRTGYNFIGWKIGTGEPQKEVTIHSGSIGDISMIAKYKAISHKVIFEPNGGNTPIKEKTVTYDESYGKLPLPTKTGYVFIGWLNENEEKITDKTMVTTVEDETLTASWAPKQHNVSFDTDGGSDVEDIVVTFDKPYGKLPETQKDGYDFAGWVDAENKVVTKDDIVKTTEDETLTAVWKKKQYSVTCKDVLGDSTHIDALLGEMTWQAEYGSFESGSKLGTNTERGFYYKGRVYTSCTDGTVSSKGLTVYRIFKNATYKTTFDPNGGSLDTPSITTEYGKPLGDLSVPEKTGHIFLGWIDEEDTPVTGTDVTPDRDQTLTAVWAVKSFDVVYKDILGTPQNIKKVLGKSKKTANFGSKVSGAELGINTERNAYYAGYVYKSSTDAIVHNNDVVVYRIFDKAKFVINYDANGGKITNRTKTVVYDDPIGKLEIPNKPGNNFITWKDGDDAITPNTIYTKTTDTTITAYYEPIPAEKPTASPTPAKEPAPTPSATAKPTVTPKSVVPDAYLVFSKTINKGDAFKIKTLNTKGCKVSWTASKKGIVKVKGMTIKAKKNGHTKLRCTVTNKKKVVVYRFGIDITVKKTGVHTLNTNKKRKSDWGRPEMLLDKTIFTNTKWKVKFKNTKHAKITYKVKNHRVVKVNKKTNTIYPKKVGYTFMTITVKQNGKTTKYMMHIKVQKPIK